MMSLRLAGLGVAVASLLSGPGCVESSIYEKTASQLDAATRAAQQKDQQIRTLEWQVVTLAQQLREAQLRGEVAQRELSAQVQQLGAANAALGERIKAKEEESARPPLPFPGDDAKAPPAEKRRADDLRRLVAALDAQNARLVERLNRLEQKLDARSAEDRNRPRTARPERTIDTDIVDPWGFGARK
jgi:DNA repair exonuclease SbcCD ATPase subunit